MCSYNKLMKKQKKLTILFIILAIGLRLSIIASLSFAYLKHTESDETNLDKAIDEETADNDLESNENETEESEDTSEGADTSNEEDDTDGDRDDEDNASPISDDSIKDNDNNDTTTQEEDDTQEDGENGNGEDEDLTPPPPPPPPPDPAIILCLGDSVTKGHPYEGSSNTYPSKLQTKLDSAYGSDEYSVINQGVNGYRADQVLANVNAWLNQYNPDIVLLMIGGNDLNQDLSPESTYEEIVSVITQTANETAQIVTTCQSHTNPDNTHPKVIVSAFIPNNLYDYWGSYAIAFYNTALANKGFANYFTSNWTDLYDTATSQAKTSLMSDSTHPNASGYELMAQNWFEMF